jgi:hypothetical protein
MHGSTRRFLHLAIFPMLATVAAAGCSDSGMVLSTPAAAGSSPSSSSRLENREVGYSLLYPGDWQVRGQVLAAEFAVGSACESVEVVDFEPPDGSGSAGLVLHSLVQICSKPITDASSLDDFMSRTYGAGFRARFRSVEMGGVAAYEAANVESDRTIFLQTSVYRLQLLAAVVADADKRAERRAQVQEILESFSLSK